jgi:hypothetical protein
MYDNRAYLFAIVLSSCGLAGCGTTVPDIKEIWDKDRPANPSTNTPKITGTAQMEFEIKKRIYCDLKEAVQEANRYFVTEGPKGRETPKTSGLIPQDWGALISLSLQVDESSALNPGISLNAPLANSKALFPSVTTPQSYSFGLGGTLSSTASRTDKFNPYYSIEFLMKPKTRDSVCRPENDPFTNIPWTPAASSPFIIESDLGIKDWLVGAMLTNDLLPSALPPTPREGSFGAPRAAEPSSPAGQGQGAATKPDTVTYEIKFVIVSTGNVTPTWKLLRVSANTGNLPFFSVGRTRTHDLIITIGPPTQATANTFLAAQIGQASKTP